MYFQKVGNKQKNVEIFFVGILKIPDEKSKIRIRSISSRYGSEDPDPYKNVTDPEHWLYLSDDIWKRMETTSCKFQIRRKNTAIQLTASFAVRNSSTVF
jgi:hypothetical protein